MISVIILLLFTYIFLYFIFNKNGYTNIYQVIKKQVKSIIKEKKERRTSDIIVFMNIYIMPLILSVFISIQYIFSKEFYNEIIVILAILVSVFLTLISILTAKSYKSKNDKQKIIIKNTFNNLYFITILSLFLIIICFITNNQSYIMESKDMQKILLTICKAKLAKRIINFIITYTIFEIIIHILIILRCTEQIFILTYED